MKYVGIEKAIDYLRRESDRYLNAGTSGYFCDSGTCLKICYALESAILELKCTMDNTDK